LLWWSGVWNFDCSFPSNMLDTWTCDIYKINLFNIISCDLLLTNTGIFLQLCRTLCISAIVPNQHRRSWNWTKWPMQYYIYGCMPPCKIQMQSNCLVLYIFHMPCITFCKLALQISGGDNSAHGQQQPTLQMVSDLLNSVTLALERVGEEKYLLLNKVFNLLIYLSH
jgi:hypothetical protein